ncbi:MAG: metal-dependent hydrolase [Paenibacillaceae bacterium]|nr:metal-dependent hydrolase [Paenibacillaceae bacterium]
MDSATHVVMGIGLGGLAYVHPAVASDPLTASAVMTATVIGSVLPDGDIVSRLWGKHAYIRNHRGMTHGIPSVLVGASILALCIALAAPPVSPLLLLVCSIAATLIHVGIDVLNSYGTQALWPWRKTWIALDIVPIFDPFLFFTHITAITLWISGIAPPQPVFAGLYALTVLYLVLRTFAHRNVLRRVATYAAPTPYTTIAVLPSWFLTRWFFVIRHTPQSYTLGLIQHDTISHVAHHDSPNTPLCDASRKDASVQAFLSFSRFPYAHVEQSGDTTIVWWYDMRYKLLQPYPLLAYVQYDRNRQRIRSDVGWMRPDHVWHINHSKGGVHMPRFAALAFVIPSILCLIFSGIALSYFATGWALTCLIASFAITGVGLAYKRRWNKHRP